MASSTERTILVMSLGLALGCGSKAADTGTDAASECKSVPWNWQNTGEPFMRTWCTSCHHSDLNQGERQGAPVGIDLVTHDDFLMWAERVDVRVWADTLPMPPAGGPTEDELEILAEWMDCGAPE